MKYLIFMSLTAMFSLPASASPDDHIPRLGAAVKHNILVQAVPVTPEQKMDTYIPADPARKALAIKKYKENKVDTPVKAQTTDKEK